MLCYRLEDKVKIDKFNKELDKEKERDFKKTEKVLKVIERIIKYARDEKWQLYYLIEELEAGIKIWKDKYL